MALRIFGRTAGALWPSLAIDVVLLGLFAVQHSAMARPAFKRVWTTRIVPEAAERSTLSQGFAGVLKRGAAEAAFVTPLFYRWVRHPIYVGFILAFWAAPRMSLGHLVFAVATTDYIVIGASLEERDLVAHFGERYRRYRESVGMLFPKLRAPRGSPEVRAP